jgi:hypothetical protein
MSKFKRTLAAILLATSAISLFGNTSEKDISKKDAIVDLTTGYEHTFQQPEFEYVFSKNCFATFFRELRITEVEGVGDYNIIKPSDRTKIANIMGDAMSGKIASYDQFIKRISDLPEEQRLIFISAFENFQYGVCYDPDLANEELGSRDLSFETVRNQLGLGICKQIDHNSERTGEDAGIEASTSSGMSQDSEQNLVNHTFNVFKPSTGIAIIDSFNYLQTKTKNVKEALKLYEELDRTMHFTHMFFKDGKFKYKLMTDQGEAYLAWLGYDLSTQTIKDELTKPREEKNLLSVQFTKAEDLGNFALNYNGVTLGMGGLEEKAQILENNLTLLKVGYNQRFSLGPLDIEPTFDLILSEFTQGVKQKDGKKSILITRENLYGFNAELLAATKNPMGFNVSARATITSFFDLPLANKIFFTDVSLGIGGSYRIENDIGNETLTPYITGQLAMFPSNLDTGEFSLQLSEVCAGIKLEKTFSETSSVSFTPSYVWRKWEHGLEANIGSELGNLNANLKMHYLQSDFGFNPDKCGIEGGVGYKITKWLEANIEAGTKIDIYDGDLFPETYANASMHIRH